MKTTTIYNCGTENWFCFIFVFQYIFLIFFWLCITPFSWSFKNDVRRSHTNRLPASYTCVHRPSWSFSHSLVDGDGCMCGNTSGRRQQRRRRQQCAPMSRCMRCWLAIGRSFASFARSRLILYIYIYMLCSCSDDASYVLAYMKHNKTRWYSLSLVSSNTLTLVHVTFAHTLNAAHKYKCVSLLSFSTYTHTHTRLHLFQLWHALATWSDIYMCIPPEPSLWRLWHCQPAHWSFLVTVLIYLTFGLYVSRITSLAYAVSAVVRAPGAPIMTAKQKKQEVEADGEWRTRQITVRWSTPSYICLAGL